MRRNTLTLLRPTRATRAGVTLERFQSESVIQRTTDQLQGGLLGGTDGCCSGISRV